MENILSIDTSFVILFCYILPVFMNEELNSYKMHNLNIMEKILVLHTVFRIPWYQAKCLAHRRDSIEICYLTDTCKDTNFSLSAAAMRRRLVASPPKLSFPMPFIWLSLHSTHTCIHTSSSQIFCRMTHASRCLKGVLAARDSIFKPQMTHHWPGSPQSYNLSGFQGKETIKRSHFLQLINCMMKLWELSPYLVPSKLS